MAANEKAQVALKVRPVTNAESSTYIYAIVVDDVVRYVGKERDKRLTVFGQAVATKELAQPGKSTLQSGADVSYLGQISNE